MSKLEAKSIVVVNGKEIPTINPIEAISEVTEEFTDGLVEFREIDKEGQTRKVLINLSHIEYIKEVTWSSSVELLP